MNKQTEALKMAIEVLEHGSNLELVKVADIRKALKACKEALESQEQKPFNYGTLIPSGTSTHKNIGVVKSQEQEPVAWYWDNFRDGKPHADVKRGSPKLDGIFGTPIPLYIHPHQWQGLTDDEIEKVFESIETSTTHRKIYCAIEAKLKEKNT